MPIFVLTITPISKASYGDYMGFVVRAKDEGSARVLCMQEAGKLDIYYRQGKDWIDNTLTSCEIINDSGDEEIILSDYLSG